MNIVIKTIDDYVTLEEVKEKKINELRDECNKSILGRFVVSVDGIDYQFSNDAEAQINFDKADKAFDRGWIEEIYWTAYDMEGNVVRILLNAEQFENVYMESVTHIQTNISKFRDFLQPIVESATTIEDVRNISW